MNILFLDLMLLFFLEVIEATMQKGNTFNELVNNLYRLREKGLIYLLSLHLSLIYVIYYYLITQNGYLFFLIAIKSIDLMLKLDLTNKIKRSGKPFSSEEYFGANDITITAPIRYSGAIFYTLLFYMIIF